VLLFKDFISRCRNDIKEYKRIEMLNWLATEIHKKKHCSPDTFIRFTFMMTNNIQKLKTRTRNIK
jgi:hypothetical protein